MKEYEDYYTFATRSYSAGLNEWSSKEPLINRLDAMHLDADFSDREPSAKYSGILRAFVEAARQCEPGDEIIYEDEHEINSAVVTKDQHGYRDGIILYRGTPDTDSRIGWYGFTDMADFNEMARRLRKGHTTTVLRGKARH